MTKFKKYLIYALATGFGSGRIPKAPGTAGSLLALVIVWLAYPPTPHWGQALFLIICSGLGVWVSSWVAHDSKLKDPQIVVIDEFAGIFFSFFLIPINPWTLISGFVLFRLFDIWKPGPIGAAEKFPRGWGIMSDDILSGIVVNILLHGTLFWMAL